MLSSYSDPLIKQHGSQRSRVSLYSGLACMHVTMWPCEVRTLLYEIMLGCSRSWLPGLTWLGVLPCNLAGHVNHDIFIMLLRRRPGHYDTRGAMGTRERRGGKRKLKTSVYLLIPSLLVLVQCKMEVKIQSGHNGVLEKYVNLHCSCNLQKKEVR